MLINLFKQRRKLNFSCLIIKSDDALCQLSRNNGICDALQDR